MNIETKFSPGDAVWLVRGSRAAKKEKCPNCAGAGKVATLGLERREITCPTCHGNGVTHSETIYEEWTVRGPITIGQVRVSITGATAGVPGYEHWNVDQHNLGPQSEKREESYMCVETGVGSGNIWHDRDMFATQDEALAEAERRTQQSLANAELVA